MAEPPCLVAVTKYGLLFSSERNAEADPRQRALVRMPEISAGPFFTSGVRMFWSTYDCAAEEAGYYLDCIFTNHVLSDAIQCLRVGLKAGGFVEPLRFRLNCVRYEEQSFQGSPLHRVRVKCVPLTAYPKPPS